MSGLSWFVLGGAIGASLVWFVLRERLRGLNGMLELEQGKSSLAETFKALADQALAGNAESVLRLAGERVAPLQKALDRFDATFRELEERRNQADGRWQGQLEALARETGKLSRALREPTTMGRWGEIQLRRVVELAGMVEHCDFEQQVSVESDGRRSRPDMTVNVPGGAVVVVDAKVPIQAYLDAADAETEGDEEQQRQSLQRHARAMREHVRALGAREYWQSFEKGPAFVVMFVPGEPFLSAACREDPRLIEEGFANHRVMVATPMTLIALLFGFANGWQQLEIAEHAEEISRHGRDLYQRLCTMTEHFLRLGKSLNRSVDAYNGAIGSLESRVLATARRFPDMLGLNGRDLPIPVQIEKLARPLQAADLVNGQTPETGSIRGLAEQA